MSRLLYPMPRECPWRRLAKLLISLPHPDLDFNAFFMAEAQYSLDVVLPGSTAFSEINSCIRQKGVLSLREKGVLVELKRHMGVFPVFFRKKGNGEKSCYIYCRLSIPLSRYAPFWRRKRGM